MFPKSHVAAALICVALAGCMKSQHVPQQATTQTGIAGIQQEFEKTVINRHLPPVSANFRAGQPKTVLWDSAIAVQDSGNTMWIVPVRYSKPFYIKAAPTGDRPLPLNQLTFLLATAATEGRYNFSLVTYVPDSSTIADPSSFNGIVLQEDWQGNSVAKPLRRSRASAAAGGKQTDVYQSIQVCTEISGYNYSPDYPDAGFAWSETSCSYYGFDQPTLSLAPIAGWNSIYGSALSTAPTVEIPPPHNPIGNITDYFKCFTNVGGSDHQYTVTLAVEQPVPGTRDPWGLTVPSTGKNPVNVGHTWLIFTETTPYGTITRNVGFYPSGIVTPQFPTDLGVLNDDELTPYNVALTINVDNGQFFNMLNFVQQAGAPTYMYNLNGNNCTAFSLSALAAGDVVIPSTPGTWLGHTGYDPGDLGQDLKAMPQASGRSLATSNSSHPNFGSCY